MSGIFQIIDPPPPYRPGSMKPPPPPAFGGEGGTHSLGGEGGGGINISEDARHWIRLLQYNPSTDQRVQCKQKDAF